MPKYYKFIFAILLSVSVSGKVWGQLLPIESIKLNTTYYFNCNKATPIDLFKAMNLYISPENGYWGDVHGAPYNGKQSTLEDIKERPLTNGNIFNAAAADTGNYVFYFYVTSSQGFCDIKTGTRFILDLNLRKGDCTKAISSDLLGKYMFCYGTNLEVSTQATYDIMTMEELLFSRQEDPLQWKVDTLDINSDWLPLEVFSDSLYTDKIGGNDFMINTSPDDNLKDQIDTFYVKVHKHSGDWVEHQVIFEIFRQNSLEVYYTPFLDPGREFDIDEDITITVENESLFTVYKYYLNEKELNKYYLGGDESSNKIKLDVLAFSGVEDFIEIIAVDTNRCVAKWSDNVVVNVPFPTAFTPDGDGINDIFLGGEKFRNREFHLEIFNRWGNRIYYGESGWDGKYRGQDVPPGTYSYVVILKQSDGSSRTIKGTVTLIRNEY